MVAFRKRQIAWSFHSPFPLFAVLPAEILVAGLAVRPDLLDRGLDAVARQRRAGQRAVQARTKVAGVAGEARILAQLAERLLDVVGHGAQGLQVRDGVGG